MHVSPSLTPVESGTSESALRESEALFHQLADSMPQIVWTARPDGQLDYYNRRWYEITAGAEGVVGVVGVVGDNTWLPFAHPEDRERLLEVWYDCVRNGKDYQIEFRLFFPKTGSYRWHLARATPVRDEQGRIVRWFGTAADIDEQKQAEQRLLRKTKQLETLNLLGAKLAGERNLEALVQSVTDAGCELTGAAFGAFFYNVTNEKGESYMLYSLSGAPREAFSKFPMPRNTAVFEPTFKGEGIVRIGDVLQDPRYGKNAPYHGMPKGHLPVRSYLAASVVSRTGEVLGGLFFGHSQPDVFTEEAEHSLRAIASQASVAIDNSNLYCRIERDLAEQKRAKEASRRLAAIVEFSEDAIISKNLNGIIQSWNTGAEELFGYTANEAIGQSILMLIPKERHHEETSILGRIQRGERVHHFETVRQRKDGSLIDISLTVSPVKDEDGKIIGASKIARDITQRRKMEQALAEAQQRLAQVNTELESRVAERTVSLQRAIAQMEEFSYSVSHDLRSPIRAIHGYAKILQTDYESRLDADAKTFLERIVRSSLRMDKLTHDLLTFSRIGLAEIKLERIELRRLVMDIVHQYPSMQSPSAVIEVAEKMSDVIGHEPSVMQAISNLIANAVKFVRSGVKPHVRVWTEDVGDFVRLHIADNGIGIEPEYQSKVFDIFERVYSHKEYEGTGIGLAIVRKAMERMGGRTGLQSDGRSGSTFWIELPKA